MNNQDETNIIKLKRRNLIKRIIYSPKLFYKLYMISIKKLPIHTSTRVSFMLIKVFIRQYWIKQIKIKE